MIRTTRTTIIAFGMLAIAGCRLPQQRSAEDTAFHKALRPFSWMHGTWIAQSGDQTIIEIWGSGTNTFFGGITMEVRDKDTTAVEYLTLSVIHDSLFYIATVPGHNEGKPVRFAFTGEKNGAFTFENPAHDFPQRIVYAHPSDSTMYARIEGMENGKPTSMEFRYRRDAKALPRTFRSMSIDDTGRVKRELRPH
jgi:hypothetical protein